jgi:hypothetical protein
MEWGNSARRELKKKYGKPPPNFVVVTKSNEVLFKNYERAHPCKK